MEPAVRVEQLGKRYRLFFEKSSLVTNLWAWGRGRRIYEDRWALRGVSFAIERGETVGIIGVNGSGKTTLLRLLGGITQPEEGRLTLRGSVTGLFELGAGFQPDLTGRENVAFSGVLHGYSRREIARRFDAIAAFAELGDFMDAPLHTYSAGMWMRLAFALAIHVDCDILLVDEVLAVGDAAFQAKCFERFRQLKERGATILLVTHDLARVRQVCNRTLWLDHGRPRAFDSAETVVAAYATSLGVSRATAAAPPPGKQWGSREAEIVTVSAGGQPLPDAPPCSTGAPWAVTIQYRTRARIARPVFGLGVFREDGTHVCGPNTAACGLAIDAIEGEGRLTFSVAALPLQPGRYLLSAAIYNADIDHPYDHQERRYPFAVVAERDEPRYGIIELTGEWRHDTHAISRAV